VEDRSGAALRRRAVVDSVETQRAVDSARDTGRRALRSDRLPRLLHEAPAACLLVDVEAGCVVQANTAGRGMAASASLPVTAAAWLAAAGIRQTDGSAFPPGRSPLERVAAGEQALGEPVLVPGGAAPRVLWVTGFPVPSEEGHEQSLVVFFEVQGLDTTLGVEMRDRAVVAAGLAFTISDPNQPTTRWSSSTRPSSVPPATPTTSRVGRNCRFLQGPDTDPAAVEEVRRLLREQEHGTVTLLNYRKDGTAFWNELSLSPVYDGDGRAHALRRHPGLTSPRGCWRARARAATWPAEQRARAEAEHAQRRLALLAEATSMLAATSTSTSRSTG
jgi:PAS domain-containing protein